MNMLNSHLRRAAARLSPGRAVIGAMLLGPVAGAIIAFGAVAAEEASGDVVNIDNFTYTPGEMTVSVGTTVKWLNRDDIPHTVAESNKLFRSKALDTDDSFSYTFTTAGTFNYFCSLHPHMTGKIIVKDKTS